MRIGTHHFKTLDHAIAYYAEMGLNADDVRRKLREGEIAIGNPVKPAQLYGAHTATWNGTPVKGWLLDKDGRYHVDTI